MKHKSLHQSVPFGIVAKDDKVNDEPKSPIEGNTLQMRKQASKTPIPDNRPSNTFEAAFNTHKKNKKGLLSNSSDDEDLLSGSDDDLIKAVPIEMSAHHPDYQDSLAAVKNRQ